MKISSTVLVTAVLVAGMTAPRSVASDEHDSRGGDVLKQLLQEVRALRTQVQRLDDRLTRLERGLGRLPSSGEQELTLDDEKKAEAILPAMPRPDTGLYVFPGLDAPPLSPLDALPD